MASISLIKMLLHLELLLLFNTKLQRKETLLPDATMSIHTPRWMYKNILVISRIAIYLVKSHYSALYIHTYTAVNIPIEIITTKPLQLKPTRPKANLKWIRRVKPISMGYPERQCMGERGDLLCARKRSHFLP